MNGTQQAWVRRYHYPPHLLRSRKTAVSLKFWLSVGELTWYRYKSQVETNLYFAHDVKCFVIYFFYGMTLDMEYREGLCQRFPLSNTCLEMLYDDRLREERLTTKKQFCSFSHECIYTRLHELDQSRQRITRQF